MTALDALKAELKAAQTMEEFLLICAKHYDFKNARPGIVSKNMLINNIGTVITLSGAKPKNK